MTVKMLMYTHNAFFFSKCIDLVPNLAHFDKKKKKKNVFCLKFNYSKLTWIMDIVLIKENPISAVTLTAFRLSYYTYLHGFSRSKLFRND